VMGRLSWPFIGERQQRFFENQMDALRGVAQRQE
jgi:hypothetical protein